MEVIDVFKSGGPVMYALLLCSICTAVIMIERGMFYHRAGKNLGIFVDNLPNMLLNKSWNDAYADAAQEDNAAAFVAQEGIRAAADIGAGIGILTFVVLSVVELVTYRNTKAYKDEEGFM